MIGTATAVATTVVLLRPRCDFCRPAFPAHIMLSRQAPSWWFCCTRTLESSRSSNIVVESMPVFLRQPNQSAESLFDRS